MRKVLGAVIFCCCFIKSEGQSLPDSHSHDSIQKVSKPAKASNIPDNAPATSKNISISNKLNSTDVIAIIAVLMSLASAIISYATYRIQRTHNIKSVKPILHIGLWDYESKLAITLKNCGAGIAIVKQYSVYRK